MKTQSFNLLRAAMIAVLLCLFLPGQAQPPATAADLPPPLSIVSPAIPDRAKIMAAIRNAPLAFIENRGQLDEQVAYYIPGQNGAIYFSSTGLTFALTSLASPEQPPLRDEGQAPGQPRQLSLGEKGQSEAQRWVVKLDFPGANPAPLLEPFNRLETHVSYFIGNDPAKWRVDVPVWGGVRYKSLYPGIDLEVTGENGQVTPRLVARQGADLETVRLRVEGVDRIALEDERLRLTTAVGEYTLPLLQVTGAGSARLLSPAIAGNQVTAPFGHPQRDTPTANAQSGPSDLLYATFLGGTNNDTDEDIAVDASGAAYVTGSTGSSDFPTTPGAFDTSFNGIDFNGVDAFVVKLNAAGSALSYATFLGGSGDDWGGGLAVDTSGAAYVTGQTWSSDFPSTPGAFDTSFNGGWSRYPAGDAFVVKLNAAGSALSYAIFLGGSGGEVGHGIAVDGVRDPGAAYVTGQTWSYDFPTTPGAFDPSFNDGGDAFVVKLNAAGSALSYATFLGGSSGDSGSGIALAGVADPGAAYVTGATDSSDFPTTPGAFDPSLNGDGDAFVVKLNAAGYIQLHLHVHLAHCGEESLGGASFTAPGSQQPTGRNLDHCG